MKKTQTETGPKAWFRRHGRDVFWSWDFGVGAFGGIVGALGVGLSGEIARGAPDVLVAEIAIGIALTSVVLASLAIFATFFDDAYRRVLENADDRRSIRGALFPYSAVAVLAGLAALIALAVKLLWPALSGEMETTGFAVATGLVAWSIAGSVQLVLLTVFHAEQRAKLMRGVRDTSSEIAKRRREKKSGSV